MKFKHKLGYMFIGCLFTIAGYILASLGGITTHAQKDEQMLDKIVCRELEVVNKEGKVVAGIVATEAGGGIAVFNAAEKGVIGIIANKDGNGSISVLNASGKGITGIGADKDGNGVVSVQNAAGKGVAIMAVDEDGDGFIQTYKNGWRTH